MKGEIFIWSVSKTIDLKSLLKSVLTGKDALVFPVEAFQALF